MLVGGSAGRPAGRSTGRRAARVPRLPLCLPLGPPPCVRTMVVHIGRLTGQELAASTRLARSVAVRRAVVRVAQLHGRAVVMC